MTNTQIKILNPKTYFKDLKEGDYFEWKDLLCVKTPLYSPICMNSFCLSTNLPADFDKDDVITHLKKVTITAE